MIVVIIIIMFQYNYEYSYKNKCICTMLLTNLIVGEGTKSRITLMFLITCGVMIVMSFLQVYLVKRFFRR